MCVSVLLSPFSTAQSSRLIIIGGDEFVSYLIRHLTTLQQMRHEFITLVGNKGDKALTRFT